MNPVPLAVRICVQGELGTEWFAIFGGLRVEPGAAGTTVISGELRDQSAFHGLITAIRDLGLSLVSLETAVSTEGPAQSEPNVQRE